VLKITFNQPLSKAAQQGTRGTHEFPASFAYVKNQLTLPDFFLSDACQRPSPSAASFEGIRQVC